MGYHLAGFEVVGVDIVEQPHYPFEFHQADARDFPLDGFDAIHASPPCQQFSVYTNGPVASKRHPNLIPSTRARLARAGVPYVIENVPGAPLIRPVRYCGSSFGLDVQRHRLFESNVRLFAPRCRHDRFRGSFAPAGNRVNQRRTVEIGVWRIPIDVQQQAIGIDWMTIAELSQAIPPAYTEHIGRQLLAALSRHTPQG